MEKLHLQSREPEFENDYDFLSSSYDISSRQNTSFNNRSFSKLKEYDEAKIFKRNNYDNEIKMNNNFNKNDFVRANKNNYKISFDKNLNVIGVEQFDKGTKKLKKYFQ